MWSDGLGEAHVVARLEQAMLVDDSKKMSGRGRGGGEEGVEEAFSLLCSVISRWLGGW